MTLALAAWSCDACSALMIISMLWTLATQEITPRCTSIDHSEVGWACFAVGCVAATACAFELTFVITAYSTGIRSLFENESLHGLRDAKVMVLVYGVLTMAYMTMALDVGHVVHTDLLAWGGPRPVYTLRYLEWSIVVPFLMLISGRADNNKDLPFPIASARCTSIYIWASWLGIVIPHEPMRWFLIVISFLAYVVASWEQLLLARLMGKSMKPAVVLFQVILFGLYGVVYLLAIFGMITPVNEQVMYTFGDMAAKIGHSVLLISIRQLEDLSSVLALHAKAVTTAEDMTRLIATASAPIFSLDHGARIETWNQKIADLTGISPENAYGASIFELISDLRQSEPFQAVQNSLAGSLVAPFELHFSDKGSVEPCIEEATGRGVRTTATLIVSFAPKRDMEGKVVGVIGVGQDLTEIKAVKEAEARKAQFMAVVSHELRSPLHGIIGLTDALGVNEKDEKRAGQLKMVKNCASRLLDLVTNIMDMTGMLAHQSGKRHVPKPLSHDPVELQKIISEVVTLVSNATDKQGHALLRKAVKLINEVSEDLPIIVADAYKCTQVFYNIVTNACKFTRQGKIVISSRVNPVRECVEIGVADTGKGIAPDALERIFEPFEQEDNSEVRNYEGIGLGLSIAREVVKQHGGDIRVQSEVAIGTTFTVRLPIAMASSERSPDEEPRELETHGGDAEPETEEVSRRGRPEHAWGAKCDAEAPRRWVREREVLQPVASSQGQLGNWPLSRGPSARFRPVILSVDDDAVNQAVIESTLSDKYEVHMAMDGNECLHYFKTHSRLPDCILLDVMMPGMSGYEVCRVLREEYCFPPTLLPILMLSAKSPEGASVTEGLAAGCNDYVSKPFEKDVLEARVRTALQLNRLHKIEVENAKHTELLHSIMPPHIVERLQSGEGMIAESHESVTILFSDIVGWTNIAESLTTSQVVVLLNELFSVFDALTEEHNVYKVETIGDAYMCAAGHDGTQDHAQRIVVFGLAMLQAVKRVQPPRVGLQLQIRVGIHTGPAFTGVVGKKVPRYCFFGDTVNILSRMESHGAPGCIHISESTFRALPDRINFGSGVCIVDRGVVEIKGKGKMSTHLVLPAGFRAPLPALARRNVCTFSSPEASSRGGGASATLPSPASDASPSLGAEALLAHAAAGEHSTSELTRQAAELEAALAAAERQGRGLLGELGEVEQARAAAERHGCSLMGELHSAEAAHEAVLRELAEANRHAADFPERLEQAKTACAHAEGRSCELAARAEVLEVAGASAEARNCSLEDQVTELEAARAAADKKTGVLEQQANELRAQLRCRPRDGTWEGPGGLTATPQRCDEEPTSTSTDIPGAAEVTRGFCRAGPSMMSTSHRCGEEIKVIAQLLDAKETELEHVRLDLQLRDRQLSRAREQLISRTEELEAKEAALHHARLDLTRVTRSKYRYQAIN
mmetsp:Transcript_87229/g.241935  ORF Transcript_87229/g.241935 Transcript_87229/m.241935 type:complete len:1428 (-) Transcript_87229:90-4373(-)